MDLVGSIWGAVGVVIVFGAIIFIIFKFFIGVQKIVGGGIAALGGVAVLAALASSPQTVIDAGEALKTLVFGKHPLIGGGSAVPPAPHHPPTPRHDEAPLPSSAQGRFCVREASEVRCLLDP